MTETYLRMAAAALLGVLTAFFINYAFDPFGSEVSATEACPVPGTSDSIEPCEI